MSVPLNNLYNWIDGLLPEPAIVYVFHPHGSKKISNLNWLKDYEKDHVWQFPAIIVHDQEPLDWDLYQFSEQYVQIDRSERSINQRTEYGKHHFEIHSKFNLKSLAFIQSSLLYDNAILIHSEKNSWDLSMYQQNGFLCVYYWAHAVIARDWYRFAEHDAALNQPVTAKNTFLIYCRDWSHRREYRLKFLELLVRNNLHHISQTSVMHTNSEGVDFAQHKFDNPAFKLDNPELLDLVPPNEFSSTASATYDHQDFLSNEISVVLETVFDDTRIHLTEKILRPIACGHPFMLAAGPGALEYLRSYGFKTFAPWIDESYDQESNSVRRLEKIIDSMTQIQKLQGQELETFSQNIKQIAEFNKKHFFSDKFFNQVTSELKRNLIRARQQVNRTRGKQHLKMLSLAKKIHTMGEFKMRKEKTQLLRQLRQSYLYGQTSPGEDPVV